MCSLHGDTGESEEESDSESERDVAVPKKRRKREAPPVPPRRMPSPEPQQEPSLSRSSSLLQFECLEQALSQEELEEEDEEEEEEEDDPMVFRTSATDKPFSSGESQPPSFSSFSFDSLDTNGSRRRCSSPLKDSLEDEDLDETASSSPGCSSSDDESYFLDRHHKLSGSLGRSRLRSYRSFDSLVIAMRPGRMPLSCVSLENAVLQEEEDENKTPSKKSSENLSEDSGFGEMSMRRQSAAQPIAEEDEEKVEEPAAVNKEEPPALDKQQPPDVSAEAGCGEDASAASADEGEAVELNLEEFEEGQVAAGWGPPTPRPQHSQGHTHDTTTVLAASSCGADHQWISDAHLVEFNSDLSVNEEPPPVPPPVCDFYCSAPSLLSEAPMSAVPLRPEPPAPAWDMHPPMEITEEVILKTTNSPDASPKTSKSNKFGSFFQRFSFRKSKGKKSPSKQSQEDITTTEAIHSVEATAAELSNLDTQLLSSKRTRAVPPPLPPVGPPKSRLLGIVGRRKQENTAAQSLATPYADGGKHQKIDIGISSNGGSKEISPRAAAAAGANKKASSLVNITAMNIVDIDISEPAPQGHHLSLSVARPTSNAANDPRAKSMEFLLDEENKAAVQVSHRFFSSFSICFAAAAKPYVGNFRAPFRAVFLLAFN